MAELTLDGMTLAYDDVAPAGARDCALLIHGYASNRNENWRRLGWLGVFERRRIRAVAFDLRGHGESGKPHDPAAYTREKLVGDVFGVLDALSLPRTILIGYSMGARLALAAAAEHPEKFSHLVLGGVGGRLFEPQPAGNPMAHAMEAGNVDDIAEPLLKNFRRFADAQGEDRLALAAFAKSRAGSFDETSLARIDMPTLVVAGARDELAGDPEELAMRIKGARSVTLPGCDHFSAIAHALFKAAVFDFLEETA